MKLLLVTFIVVATLAINICESNAFPSRWKTAEEIQRWKVNSAARDIVRKCESGELTGPKCEGRFHHMARSLDRTEGPVMEGKYSMQFYRPILLLPALAKLLCLALLGFCLSKFAYFLADLCTSTGPGNNTCTWLRECCRQVEAEVVSNSRNQLHQTTYKYYFRAQYST